MDDTDISPFETSKWDDAPLPPVSEVAPLTDTAAGVASMIDSPFASSLITPGLLEQLSHSIVEGDKAASASNDSSQAADSHGQHMTCAAAAARAASDAAGGDGAASTGSSSSQSAAPRLQGVASILESPFASTCLTQEAQQLQQLQLNGGDKATA
jgi:hypothetical protein